MNFKIGQIVKFNNSNYIVMDSQHHTIDGVAREYLHIRDIVSNDVINVDAVNVELVDLNHSNVPKFANSFDDFESSSEKAEKDLIENKTVYLNSLFSQVKEENTEDFFNLDTDTFTEDKIERIKEDTSDESFDKPITSDLVQNFSMPTDFIKPRRKINTDNFDSKPVDATFSDLEVATVIPTSEFKKTEEKQASDKFNIPNNFIKPRNDAHPTRENIDVEQHDDMNLDSFLKESRDENNIKESFKFDEDITKLIQDDATNVDSIVEPGFSESVDDDLTITSDTNTTNSEILAGLNDKADKYKERQKEILATGPINIKKLQDHVDNQKNNDSILDEITMEAISNDGNGSTDSIFKDMNVSPQDVVNRSKIYGTFKKMSAWFIALWICSILLPILGIIMKIASNFVLNDKYPMSFGSIFDFSFDSINVLSFISAIMIYALFPLFFLVTLIYSVVYVVITLKRQYRRLAYFNYQLSNDSKTIKSLQDFSNEASVFMIKLHNENKDMKKQIKKITKLSSSNAIKNFKKVNNKEMH